MMMDGISSSTAWQHASWITGRFIHRPSGLRIARVPASMSFSRRSTDAMT